MKIKGVFLAAILTAVLCISGNVFAVLSGGGTEANPYLIQSHADFNDFANPANAALYWADGVCTKLMCDPNLSDTTYTQAVIAPDTNSTNSDFQGTQFTGIFEGNGHTISNLTITASTQDYIGLFGYVGSGGRIRNLGVEDVNLTGRSYVGGLAGHNSGTLTGCYATGSVSGLSYVGGLVGVNDYSSITACYANGSVSGTGVVGGLAGLNWGTLTACYATGSVSGTSNLVGGLVGLNRGTLTACYATGSVSGTSYYVGGLVGDNSGTLTACYATGSVSGLSYVGGLMGASIYGSITTCYATGSVSGTWEVGGLVGDNYMGTLTGCYATGPVSGNGEVGGLVGDNWPGSTLTACFWDKDTSETDDGVGNIDPDPAGVTGKTMAQMKTQSTFTDAGWDFVNTWWMADNSYPHLIWEHYEGSGTQADPYQIANVADFQLLSAMPTDWDKSFILTANINLTGLTFNQAPIAPDTDSTNSGFQGTAFTGVFDGNDHVISNLTITASTKDFIGLFGNVGSGGKIRNLGIESVNIIGRYYVGGLVGYNSGTLNACYAAGSVSGTGRFVGGLVGENYYGSLTGCYATGSVSGTGDSVGGLVGDNWSGSLTSCYATGSVSGTGFGVGGLAGWNYFSSTLTSCYATGSVSGADMVGGLVGDNSGTLTSCYATGSVSGTDIVGGLVGWNSGTLTSCYATGSASGTNYVGGLVGRISGGTLTSCFWDKDTSETDDGVGNIDPDPAGAMGKNTVDMKTLSTFTDAGWDFSATDGDPADWRMLPYSYPRLVWEDKPVANAGPDQIVEQTSTDGAEVFLDGSGDCDLDCDTLTYEWSWNTYSTTGINPQVTMPVGLTTVTLVVSDGTLSASDTVVINVVDTTSPVVTITAPTASQYAHSDALTLNYSVTDFGSGVNIVSVTATMDGSTTLAGHGLANDQKINLLTELALGQHTFTVAAEDNAGNSATQSVTFSIIATPESIDDDVSQSITTGQITEKNWSKSLLGKLDAAAAARANGDCATASSYYNAFIKELRAQSGKKVDPTTAQILIADAQYLMTHCP